MEIELKEQQPDGINIEVENIIAITIKDATRFIEIIYALNARLEDLTDAKVNRIIKILEEPTK